MRERSVCNECGKLKIIVNKKYALCDICNRKRLGNPRKMFSLKKGPLGNKPRKSTGERAIFLSIWDERPHYCENCGKPLGDTPKTHFFSHKKSKGAFPEQRLIKDNIELLCYECHYLWDHGSHEEFLKRKRV